MKNFTETMWRKKVAANVLNDYDKYLPVNDRLHHSKMVVTLHKASKLPLEVEILSALDERFIIDIPLVDLPQIASLNRVKQITRSFDALRIELISIA